MLIKKQFTTFLTVLILCSIIVCCCSPSSPSSSSSCDRFCSYSYSHSTTTIPPLGTPSYTQTNLNAECREANDACRSPRAVAGNCQLFLLRRLVKQREQTDIAVVSDGRGDLARSSRHRALGWGRVMPRSGPELQQKLHMMSRTFDTATERLSSFFLE